MTSLFTKYLSQETAKGPFGFQVKQPPVLLQTVEASHCPFYIQDTEFGALVDSES